jgi:hypothetical protein
MIVLYKTYYTRYKTLNTSRPSKVMYLMGIEYLKVLDREREWLAKLMSMVEQF